MARICPQCEEIHFETTTQAMPTHCRRCEADLNGVAGIAPLIQQQKNDAKNGAQYKRATSSKGRNQFLIGLLFLLLGGGGFYYGFYLRDNSIEAKAFVVKVDKSMKVPPSKVRNNCTAYYMVKGKKEYAYPGVRADGDSFDVYYSPSSPGESSEEKPFIILVVAGFLVKIGFWMFVWGLFKFLVARAQERDYHRTMGFAVR